MLDDLAQLLVELAQDGLRHFDARAYLDATHDRHLNPAAIVWQHINAGVPRDERYGKATRAVTSLPALAPLIEHGARGGIVRLGQFGSGITAETIVAGLIVAALREAVFVRASIEPDAIAASVSRELDRLAQAAAGRQHSTWCIIGMDAGALLPGRRLRVPWGWLISDPLFQLAPSAGGGIILAVHVKVRAHLVAGDPPRPTRNDQRWAAAESAADRAARLLALSFVLADDPTARASAPIIRWESLIGSLVVGMRAWTTHSHHEFADPLDAKGEAELLAWAKELERVHAPALDVAADRLVRAVSERRVFEDQLIDAVIAWENICGSTPETTFRVTASLAKLLHPPGPQRLAEQEQLERIYRMRSGVVHGQSLRAGEVSAAAGAAMAVARRALRAIYREHPDLVPLRSEQRANQLLMLVP
jgi:hypothetical protein